MKKKLIIILIMLFTINLNVDAKTIINPEWIKYNSLDEEEKLKYHVIPEEYIYEFESKKNNTKFNNIKVYESDILPSKYNLTNVVGKNYVNTINENQSSLGLCWAFASLGAVESNILLHGVEGLEDEIAKCDSSNPDSRACRYKADKELNDKYINGEVEDNAIFSKRNADYIISKPYDTKAYNQSGTFTIIAEKYNPYGRVGTIGGGGNFGTMGKLFSYGVAPRRALNEWSTYKTTHETMTLEQVFDSVDTDYVVTDWYRYSIKPSDATKIEEWQNGLKKLIMTYGSAYVGTIAPDTYYSGACYYYNQDEKMGIINYDDNCGTTHLGSHALQIVGWDDDYEYGYCRVNSTGKSGYTKDTCESAGYTWASGKGAWILKNSWGATYVTYVYLTYASKTDEISGVKNIKVKDFDNVYNEKISHIEYFRNEQFDKNIVYKYYKSNEVEYLSRIAMNFDYFTGDYTISVSNDGINYTVIDTGTIDLLGGKSFNANDYALTGNSFYIKVEGPYYNADSIPNVFTKNECSYLGTCTDDYKVSTYLEKNYLNKTDNIINVKTKTSNIKSGSQLDYKIYHDNVDVSSSFNILNNYVVTNNNIATITFPKEMTSGKYTIKTTYESTSNETNFYILDNEPIKLSASDEIYASDKTAKIDYEILIEEEILNKTWQSSNTDVATINDGILTLKKGGKFSVTLVVSTISGDVSKSIEIIIYDDKIETAADFSKIFSSSNNKKNYYITNDLDFTGVNYDNVSGTYYGILNGGYRTIKNLTRKCSNSNGCALIAKLKGGVKNLYIANSTFTNTNGPAGSVSASLSGSSVIENVYVADTVTVSGTTYAGGIAGNINSNSTCKKCVFKGKVIGNSTSNDLYVGGIAGYSFFNGIVENSYNSGVLEATSSYSGNIFVSGIMNTKFKTNKIINSYNIGEIKVTSTGNATIATNGLDASNLATITNSYYLEDEILTLKTENVRSIDKLKDKSNYNNWDFETIWYMKEYPELRTFTDLVKVYKVNFYDEDRKTIIKTMEVEEGQVLEVESYFKEDDEYAYEFLKWDGYTSNMKVESDINLYVVYEKKAKYIKTDTLKIDNSYIKNIKTSSIFDKYLVSDFKNNISHDEGFNLYEGENISTSSYLKTGMMYKNQYKTYKIVVGGDVTGDGLIKMNDVMKLATHLVDGNILKEEYLQAGDLTDDNNIKMNDLMKLATTIVNGGSL